MSRSRRSLSQIAFNSAAAQRRRFALPRSWSQRRTAKNRFVKERARTYSLRMTRRWLAVAGLLTLTVGCASLFRAGAQSIPAPRSAAEIFNECLKCHSKVDLVQRGPRLEGLPAWYVVQQLNKFKAGIRGTNTDNKPEALMGSTFAGIPLLKDDAEIKAVAAHIASLPPLAHQKVVAGNAARGQELYQYCVACHGLQAQGNEQLKAPPLDVQEDWYLLRELIFIKNGDRGSHPADLEARTMQLALGAVDATNFPDLIRYIAETLVRTTASPTNAANRNAP